MRTSDDLTPQEIEFTEALEWYEDTFAEVWRVLAAHGVYSRPNRTLAQGVEQLVAVLLDDADPEAVPEGYQAWPGVESDVRQLELFAAVPSA